MLQALKQILISTKTFTPMGHIDRLFMYLMRQKYIILHQIYVLSIKFGMILWIYLIAYLRRNLQVQGPQMRIDLSSSKLAFEIRAPWTVPSIIPYFPDLVQNKYQSILLFQK